MELRGNIKRIGNGETGLTVNEPKKVTIHRSNKIIDIQPPQTKAEKAKGIVSDLIHGFQRFADYAATTKAGSQSMDEMFGLPNISNNDDIMGLPDSTGRKASPKRRRR